MKGEPLRIKLGVPLDRVMAVIEAQWPEKLDRAMNATRSKTRKRRIHHLRRSALNTLIAKPIFRQDA